jgi:hypothetical protein
MLHGALHDLVARQEVASVDLLDVEPGERRNQLGDRPASGVHLHRDRDRVLVVLDDVDDRELEVAGRVEALPELAFARRPIA